MKIAATYDCGTNTIFQHFGKTQNFKIYEIENNKIIKSEVIDNGGFGHHDLAVYLKNLGVEILILGNRGQGAIDALNNAGIKQLAGITGNPDEAVQAFLNGTLKDNPDARCNHHGEHDGEKTKFVLIRNIQSKAEVKKSVFFLTGDYWHSAESIKPLCDKLFDNEKWNVTFTRKPEDLYSLNNKPDLIVTFKDPVENDQIPTPVWCDEKWTSTVIDLVEKNGTGIIVCHAAVTDLDINHALVQKVIKSMFVTHPEQCPVQIEKIAEHPVMKDVENFEFPDFDEHYQMKMLENTSCCILAKTKSKNGEQPAVWVNELGKGKICCITPAHTTGNLLCPGFFKIMENSVEWCTKN